jgi:hypothetical protein
MAQERAGSRLTLVVPAAVWGEPYPFCAFQAPAETTHSSVAWGWQSHAVDPMRGTGSAVDARGRSLHQLRFQAGGLLQGSGDALRAAASLFDVPLVPQHLVEFVDGVCVQLRHHSLTIKLPHDEGIVECVCRTDFISGTGTSPEGKAVESRPHQTVEQWPSMRRSTDSKPPHAKNRQLRSTITERGGTARSIYTPVGRGRAPGRSCVDMALTCQVTKAFPSSPAWWSFFRSSVFRLADR